MTDSISFIIAIITSVGLISSEILPFIPIEGNGMLHSICFYLSKLNSKQGNSAVVAVADKDIEKGIPNPDKPKPIIADKPKPISDKPKPILDKGTPVPPAPDKGISIEKELLEKLEKISKKIEADGKSHSLLMNQINDKVKDIHLRIV